MPTPRGPDADNRSEERKQAEQIYLKSKGDIKLIEIAEKLELPDNKIRKWKCMDNWEGKLHSSSGKEGKKKLGERSTDSKGNAPPKRGAPKGNQNAKGGRGNPNPKPPPDVTKHGGYSAVYWDVLDEEEKGLIEELSNDEEVLLLEQIQLFSVRERRIMQAINKYRNTTEPVAISYTSRMERKRSFNSKEDEELYNSIVQEKIKKKERMPGREYSSQTNTENKDQIILRLEAELSNVQAKKTKAIDALAKLHFEKQRLAGNTTGNEVVRAWAEKVKGMRGERHE